MLYDLLSNPIFWCIVLNIAGYSTGYYAGLSKNMRNDFYTLPDIIHKAYVIIFFVLPLCVLPILPQDRFDFHIWLLIPGVILVGIGLAVEVSAFLKIGFIPGGKAGNKVRNSGIYHFIRHPIYSGTLLWATGIALIFRAKYALLYIPILVVLTILLVLAEEKGLIENFGEDYTEYQKKTKWRLFPYLF